MLLSENEQESPLLSSENVQRVVNLLETSVQVSDLFELVGQQNKYGVNRFPRTGVI